MNNAIVQDKLNELLSTVYDLQDASDGASKDLEILISRTVQQVEEMIDENDKIMGEWV
jgi:uncharacterized phage infection (PIP) family protein YhgE